ncbi:YHS domain-containing (seleno)protein [Sessilibacter corallicola]|nr:YHS domain-containing (seleno)protein [Sessilibacter corallicola]MCE2030290.1 YHS domain-containing protein [Sessilibacter corallicola]
MSRFTPYKVQCFFSAFLFLFVFQSHAKESHTEIMVNAAGYAIHGYDPVSYFVQGEPKKGLRTHQYKWHGATWLFGSKENKNLFMKSPEKYAPQYGGWCAFGAADGYAAEPDPLTSWTIYKDKLYLNYNQSVLQQWGKDIPTFLEKAKTSWPQLSSELEAGTAKVYWK